MKRKGDRKASEQISPEEVEKRLKAWADITSLALELRLGVLRNRYPDAPDEELRMTMWKELMALRERRDVH